MSPAERLPRLVRRLVPRAPGSRLRAFAAGARRASLVVALVASGAACGSAPGETVAPEEGGSAVGPPAPAAAGAAPGTSAPSMPGPVASAPAVPAPAGPAAAGPPPWTNPTPDPSLPRMEGHPDLNSVPEGLTLVDDDGRPTSALDPAKGVVVFVHGRSGKGDASAFPEPRAWRAAGWNALVFRWHRRSFDAATIPRTATATIPDVADELVAAMGRLRASLGGTTYRGELRVVGHSLGAIVGTLGGRRVDALFAAAGPPRYELLDPGYFRDALRPRAGDLAESVDVELQLGRLVADGARVVVYSTVVSRLFEAATWRAVNVQYMAQTWLGFDVAGRHDAMIPYYFRSLGAAPPPVTGGGAPAFSASLPSAAIPSTPRYLAQTAGVLTMAIDDDVYTSE